nr:MAG: shikimate dehydrogenase (NADP(+)) [Bacteroidota bacterium]
MIRYVALIGHPVAHSLSPLIHNRAFAHDGLPYQYLALDVPDPNRLPAVLLGLWAMDFLGANVTLPYKEAVLPWMDELSDTVRAVGAANTIVRDGERWWAENTDVVGFIRALEPEAERIEAGTAVVFGAGGAARAVVYGLLTTYRMRRITILARRPERAHALVAQFRSLRAEVCWSVPDSARKAAEAVRRAQLLVNTTPLGMEPHGEALPWPDSSAYRPGQVAFDLVYRPRPTRWLKEASLRGLITIDGLPMLLYQAAAAYRLWTGREMPLQIVQQALEEVL